MHGCLHEYMPFSLPACMPALLATIPANLFYAHRSNFLPTSANVCLSFYTCDCPSVCLSSSPSISLSLNIFLHLSFHYPAHPLAHRSTHLPILTYIFVCVCKFVYMYTYICVCVCVCVCDIKRHLAHTRTHKHTYV